PDSPAPAAPHRVRPFHAPLPRFPQGQRGLPGTWAQALLDIPAGVGLDGLYRYGEPRRSPGSLRPGTFLLRGARTPPPAPGIAACSSGTRLRTAGARCLKDDKVTREHLEGRIRTK